MADLPRDASPPGQLVEPIATALGEVIASTEMFPLLSHELTQPLTAALGGAVSMRRLNLTYKDRDKLVELVIRNLNQLSSVLNSFVTFGNVEAGELLLDPSPINLHELFEQVTQDAGEGRTYGINCPRDLQLEVDVTLFRQVLSNLMINARKFSSRGSVITLNGRSEEERVLLSVVDEGPGLPTNTERLFEKNFTGATTGHGLGLYVAKKIVEAHGGKIWADNTATGGAEFHVSLPAP